MISGVRASSIRMLSASSTGRNEAARCTGLSPEASVAWPSMWPIRSVCPSADAAQQQAIAKKIEAEFLGRAVGDVALVGLAALRRGHRRRARADRHAQQADRSGPIHRRRGRPDSRSPWPGARPLPVRRVQVQRQRGGERFAFAGLHFGDERWCMAMPPRICTSKCRMPTVRTPGLAHQGKRLGQQRFERLAAFGPIAQRQAPFAQFAVGEFLQLRLKRGDGGDDGRPFAEPSLDGPLGQNLDRRADVLYETSHERDSAQRCDKRRNAGLSIICRAARRGTGKNAPTERQTQGRLAIASPRGRFWAAFPGLGGWCGAIGA